MAKPRKPKNDDSSPLVRHQKLCLAIDLENRRIYGHTELEITVPENGIIGLHADDLEISSVTIDGESVRFDVFPHFQTAEIENRWCSVSTTTSAADAAGATYITALDRELMPNLLIFCPKPVTSDQLVQEKVENGEQVSGEMKQNVKLVRIDYLVEKAETGVHYADNFLFTDCQIRRARCWFPCFDDVFQKCCFDLEFTVAQNLVAVSTGELLYQVLSKDDPPRKTYVYKVGVPVAAQWISLAVGPFQIIPDRHSGLISHMCLPSKLSDLQHTIECFYASFSHFENYLAAPFPFGSYKQVFIAPEMAVSSCNVGASMSIMSSQILYDERIIDQAIKTRTKLAYALAKQWFGVFITPETPNDEWLLDGLAGYMTDSFIKQSLGSNEARYQRYKANCEVCKIDDSGATALSSSANDLYGTENIGLYGKIRTWKSVAILQMLEKQMGPESFCKILQRIIGRARQTSNPIRTLSTKEFRQFANKIGNLERPFLREFFPRWVSTSGCPVLRMGFSYNKRKNMVELAVFRECSAISLPITPSVNNGNLDFESDNGWPGMMSIRVHEHDGTYDHPILSMAGDTCQLLEIQCHSKIAAKRFQKTKRGSKADNSDDNGDMAPALDARSSADSPLFWLRADPEMEYLADIYFNQPVQMWINQLEKDKDVVAQAQAVATLEALPQLSFSIVNALSSFLSDSKVYWRVRIDAAFALATTASEDTDWAGLLHLVKFYKNRRFDSTTALPKPNDFHDFPEYFVLEAIPKAIASVRASDKKSPSQAVEFILQLLKFNDNNGNPYSDAFWLATLVQSVGQLEFGQQSVILLSSLLKRLDRLLQFDRLMPSYNGILTVSCIQSLTQTALKLSGFIPLDRVYELIEPYRDPKMIWQVRVEANRALLDLRLYGKGIDDALQLFIKFLNEEPYLRGQVKLSAHALRLCHIRSESESKADIRSTTLVALLRLVESRMAFNNVLLRHNLFCILQVLALRLPTLFGIPRNPLFRVVSLEPSVNQPVDVTAQSKPEDAPCGPAVHSYDNGHPLPETPRDIEQVVLQMSNDDRKAHSGKNTPHVEAGDHPNVPASPVKSQQGALDSSNGQLEEAIRTPANSKEVDTVSNSQSWRMPVVKIKVKRSAASIKAEEADKDASERFHGVCNESERGATSSNSVDAPASNFDKTVGTRNQNFEESHSLHDHGSHISASIGSVKLTSDFNDRGKELQCTADSSKLETVSHEADQNPALILETSNLNAQAARLDHGGGESLAALEAHLHGRDHEKEKDKDKKKKDKKRKRDDPRYLEKKRLKKEKKKQKLKELGILPYSAPHPPASVDSHLKAKEPLEKPPPISTVDAVASANSQSQRSQLVDDKQSFNPVTEASTSAHGQVMIIETSEQDQNKAQPTTMQGSNLTEGGIPKTTVNITNTAPPNERSAPPKFRIKIKTRRT